MKYEKEFRISHPETIGETDKEFDMYNYVDWLEKQLEGHIQYHKDGIEQVKSRHPNLFKRVKEGRDKILKELGKEVTEKAIKKIECINPKGYVFGMCFDCKYTKDCGYCKVEQSKGELRK